MPPAFTTVIDDFNRSNGALGANWSSVDPVGSTGTDWTIASNQVLAVTSAYLAEYWTGGASVTFGPDCAVGVTVAAAPSGSFNNISLWLGLHGGVGTASADGHRLTIEGTQVTIETITNGSESAIGAAISETRQAGDTYVLERIGSTLTAWRLRGGSWTNLGTRTAVYTAAGSVGLSMYDPGGTGRLDDFIGGTISSSGEAPAFTVSPAITGDPYIGDVLTCDGGTATGDPTPTKSYQWKVNGSNISGETSSTYTIDDADLDVGDSVTCEVTATNTEGSDSDTSNSITILETPTGGPEPNCFVMTAGGLEPCVSRAMTAGGLFPPVA